MSSDEPGPTHSPYGQPDPYGQPPQGSPYGAAPTGQPYGYGQQPAYGSTSGHGQGPGPRPGTVTAGAWIAIVFSGLTALLFAGVAAVFALAPGEFRDSFQDEWNSSGGSDVQIDVDSVIGVTIAVLLGFAIWCLIAMVLAIFVLRRSNVARVLLVISSGVAAAISLIGIGSGVSIIWLAASVATIVLVFVGNAGNWFKGIPAGSGAYGGYQAYGAQSYGSGQYPQYGQQYGQQADTQQPYGAQPTQPYPTSGEQQPSGYEPYGQQPTNPYGQQPPPSGDSGESGGSEYPPKDYPGR